MIHVTGLRPHFRAMQLNVLPPAASLVVTRRLREKLFVISLIFLSELTRLAIVLVRSDRVDSILINILDCENSRFGSLLKLIAKMTFI
jgi:hypothetical protein